MQGALLPFCYTIYEIRKPTGGHVECPRKQSLRLYLVTDQLSESICIGELCRISASIQWAKPLIAVKYQTPGRRDLHNGGESQQLIPNEVPKRVHQSVSS